MWQILQTCLRPGSALSNICVQIIAANLPMLKSEIIQGVFCLGFGLGFFLLQFLYLRLVTKTCAKMRVVAPPPSIRMITGVHK